jgi:hypothetical protein
MVVFGWQGVGRKMLEALLEVLDASVYFFTTSRRRVVVS